MSLLCPQPSRALTSLGVKARVLLVAQRPCTTCPVPSSLSPPCSLCSSQRGLLAVPPTPSCPRSFACCVPAAPNPAIGPSNPSPSSFRSFSETTSSVTCFDDGRTNCHNPHRRQFSHIYPNEKGTRTLPQPIHFPSRKFSYHCHFICVIDLSMHCLGGQQLVTT